MMGMLMSVATTFIAHYLLHSRQATDLGDVSATGAAPAQHTIPGLRRLFSAEPIQASFLPTHGRELGRGSLAAQVRPTWHSAACACLPLLLMCSLWAYIALLLVYKL